MRKGECRGQEVAVKVPRVYSNDVLQGVVRVGSSLRAILVHSVLI